MEQYEELIATKKKYQDELLKIEKVHAVGVRVLENKIVVYTDDISPKTLSEIPFEVENIQVDCMGMEKFTSLALADGELSWGKKKHRPAMGGITIGHIGIGTGTLGSWWFSKDLQRPVIVSNNHVLANASSYDTVQARCRQNTNSLSVSIATGGIPYIGTQLEDYGTDMYKWIGDVNIPTIQSLSTSSVKAGDELTITGKSLGFRKGYSKVWFEQTGTKVEAIVKSWNSVSTQLVETHDSRTIKYKISKDTNSTVTVYVPAGLFGTVNVFIEVEGDPIMQRGIREIQLQDGLSAIAPPDEQLAQLEKYIPVEEAWMDEYGYWMGANMRDVAIATPLKDEYVDSRILGHGAHDPVYYNYQFYDEMKEFRINGLQDKVCEYLPIVKTGRTTGTTYNVILDPSISFEIGYTDNYTGLTYLVKADDAISVYQIWSDDIDAATGKRKKMMCHTGGDSGSSYLVCTKEDYWKFMQYYNATHYGFKTVTADQFTQVEQFLGYPIDSHENYFVGNVYWGLAPGDDPSSDRVAGGGGDKWQNWLPQLNLDIIAPKVDMNIDSISECNMGVIGPINITSDYLQPFDAVSTMDASVTVPIPTLVDDINLYQDVQHINPLNLDFSLYLNGEIPSISISASFDSVTELVAPLWTIPVLSISVPIDSSLTFGFTLSTVPILTVPINIDSISTINMSLTVSLTSLSFPLNIDSTSTIGIELNSSYEGILIPIEIDTLSSLEIEVNSPLLSFTIPININSESNIFMNLIVLPSGWEPSTQYENIYFEITRSIDIDLAV